MQASDKVEFVQYLEKNGVIDVLTKGLSSCFPLVAAASRLTKQRKSPRVLV